MDIIAEHKIVELMTRIKELEKMLEVSEKTRKHWVEVKDDYKQQLARYYDVHHWAIQKFPNHPISKRMTEECKLPLFSPKEFESEQND